MDEIKKIVDLIVDLIERKNEMLSDLYKLTLAQKKLIESMDMDRLNRIIRNKEKIIEKIDKIDDKFLKEYQGIKEKYNIDELTELNVEKNYLIRLKEATKKCSDKVMEISEMDKKNSNIMSDRFDNVKTKLKEIKRGKTTTNKYYNKSPQTGGYFIDSKK